MNEPKAESVVERKTRERLAFLALPPEEAQRMISLSALGPTVDVTDLDQDLSSGLEEVSPYDEMVDE